MRPRLPPRCWRLPRRDGGDPQDEASQRLGPPQHRPLEEAAPAVVIVNGYLPGVTVAGIRVRCNAAAPARGSTNSRCQPICGVARSVWRGLRPSVVANRGLAILAESSEPATIMPRATRLTPMMKCLIIAVFCSRWFGAFVH
jgi:hypothetical protein